MSAKTLTIIEARPKTASARFRELFKYRTFYPFLLREITMKKWKGTLLGFWWLILRPLVPAAIAVVTFTFIVPMESYGIPYAVFYLAGFMTWTLFQATVAFMPRTMLWMRGIMKKTYFPKLLVPMASIGPPLIELTVVSTMFVAAVVWFFLAEGRLYLQFDWTMLMVLPCFGAALLFGMAIGMVASIMALFVRDVVFTVPYFVGMMMFLTPVLYPITFVPLEYRWIIYLLNPMAKLIETTRFVLTGQGVLDPLWLSVSFGTIAVIFAASAWFFIRVEALLADAL